MPDGAAMCCSLPRQAHPTATLGIKESGSSGSSVATPAERELDVKPGVEHPELLFVLSFSAPSSFAPGADNHAHLLSAQWVTG